MIRWRQGEASGRSREINLHVENVSQGVGTMRDQGNERTTPPRVSNRRNHRHAVAVAVTAFLLAACVSPSASSSSGQPTAALSSTLTIGLNTGTATLDPQSLSAVPIQTLDQHIFEPLVIQNEKLEFVPALATSWERIGDLTWRFHLRDGVKFHDGASFNADDVVYTINRVKDTKLTWVTANNRTFAKDIDHITRVDSLTVDMTTNAPTAFLLSQVIRLVIIPKNAADSGAQFGTKPIGTGPYKFSELVPGERIVLDRFDGYWGPKPPTAKLVVRMLTEDATRVAALQAGEVQVINAVPISAVAALKSDARFQVESVPSHRTIMLALRTTRPPLNDVRVRQAIAYAIDKKALTDKIFAGTAIPATAPYNSAIYGALSGLPPYDYNPQKAKQLLADAGYPNGFHLTYGIPLGNYLEEKQTGEAIAGMLEAVGISVRGYEEVDWASFFPAATTGKKYDIYFFGLGNTDPSNLLYYMTLPLYHDWSPSQVSGLMAQVIAGPQDKALAPIQQLEKLMWDEQPWVFLYYQPQVLALDARVKGVPARIDEFLDFTKATFAGGQ